MLDGVRTLLHRAIQSPKGESIAAVRVPKEIARTVNDLLGQPLCDGEELSRRRVASARLDVLKSGPRFNAVKREQAPVMVYFEKDRNVRELQKIKDVLAAHDVKPKLLDVHGDEATMSFVMREAKCDRDMLPVVFVGGSPIGTFRELVSFDARGDLRRAIFGS